MAIFANLCAFVHEFALQMPWHIVHRWSSLGQVAEYVPHSRRAWKGHFPDQLPRKGMNLEVIVRRHRWASAEQSRKVKNYRSCSRMKSELSWNLLVATGCG
jgi:hypothetical protein